MFNRTLGTCKKINIDYIIVNVCMNNYTPRKETYILVCSYIILTRSDILFKIVINAAKEKIMFTLCRTKTNY